MHFLNEHQADIRGRCLEFADRNYIDQFGGPDVEHADVLHLEQGNPVATVIADITKPNDIPDDYYDCIICTHVLHVIEDLQAAVDGMHRILRPGGVLLAAVPHISMVNAEFGELWRFTPQGLHTLLSRRFGEEDVQVHAYGNSLVAAGELRGLVADEFTERELNDHDPMMPVEVCARAIKRVLASIGCIIVTVGQSTLECLVVLA